MALFEARTQGRVDYELGVETARFLERRIGPMTNSQRDTVIGAVLQVRYEQHCAEGHLEEQEC